MCRLNFVAVLWLLVCANDPRLQATEPHPNFIVGTQAVGGPYQFTEDNYLVEAAREIQAMGSNLLKFSLNARSYHKEPYYMEEIGDVKSMTDLLRRHPVYQEVLAMDFDIYHFWAIPLSRASWQDGLDEAEEQELYEEFHELATYLLTRFKGTGKSFYIGHWEGDWLLKGKMDPNVDPTPERIAGFAQYLNVRQRAINDAREALPDNGVTIYHYTEVNMVWKGIDGKRPTLTNSVLPLVDVDFVSYSAYDTIQREDMKSALHRALDHIESQLKPRTDIVGKRVFVGEYAIKASSVGYDREEHERRNREVTRAILEWGCPFALYWEFYCNEPKGDSYEGFWLVDSEGAKWPLYETFKNYYKSVRTYIEEARGGNASVPGPEAIREFAIDYFSNPRDKNE